MERNKKTLGTTSTVLGVGDHNFTKFNLTPSVYIICDIPVDPTDSFYRGNPYVLVKDAIFQASSPYRHTTEFVKLSKAHFSDDSLPPIMMFYHDGGPDHRVKFYSVISYICAFRWLP